MTYKDDGKLDLVSEKRRQYAEKKKQRKIIIPPEKLLLSRVSINLYRVICKDNVVGGGEKGE